MRMVLKAIKATFWVTAILALWSFTFYIHCHAAEPVRCPLPAGAPAAATASKSGLVCHQGALGQWFPAEAAKRLLRDIEAGRAAQELARKLEARLSIDDSIEKQLLLQLELQEKITGQWQDMAKQQAALAQRKRAWYKSPSLWFTVGFVAAGALGFGLVGLYAYARD